MQRLRLIFLDGPTTGLTPKVISIIKDKILNIRARGIGAILVEQNLRMAIETCERVYVMVSGRIVAEGSSKSYNVEELGRLFFGKQ